FTFLREEIDLAGNDHLPFENEFFPAVLTTSRFRALGSSCKRLETSRFDLEHREDGPVRASLCRICAKESAGGQLEGLARLCPARTRTGSADRVVDARAISWLRAPPTPPARRMLAKVGAWPMGGYDDAGGVGRRRAADGRGEAAGEALQDRGAVRGRSH